MRVAPSALLLCVVMGAGVAFAQPVSVTEQLPSEERNIPVENPVSDPMLSTREAQPPLPWLKAQSAPGAPAPLTTKPTHGIDTKKVPFGRAEPTGRVIPSGPHASVAVPVEEVDSIEASEPAPPTPIEPEADPVTENPEAPTELTSPIYGPDPAPYVARKITFRALNKVTAQSDVLTLRQNEVATFGQLEITAITCRVSNPDSQFDVAGLLAIAERMPVSNEKRPLFRGWMYASSPSVNSLEHPVYDISMLDCKMAIPTPAKEEADEKKSSKKKKNNN